MYYIFYAAIIVVGAMLLHRLFSHASEPDFKPKPLLSNNRLALKVFKLAQSSQTVSPHGKGLSLRLISKHTKKCYYALKGVPVSEQFDFQTRLLDNLYTLTKEIAKAKKSLKESRFLPHVGGLPRIYNLCQLIVKSTEGVITNEILQDCLTKFNSITPLNHDEIQFLPLFLRYALLEFLCIYCARATVAAKGRKSALKDVNLGRLNLNNLNKNSYLYFFSQFAYGDLARSFASLCEKNDISIESKTQNYIHLISGYNSAVESAFSSLRGLEAALTDEFLLELSPLNELLKGENVVYNECTLPTKNVYLHHICRRAKKAKKGELYFARTLIDAAQKDNVDIAAKILPSYGGYYAMRLYIFLVVLLSLGLCALPAIFFGFLGIVFSILLFPTSVAVVLSLANDLNARFCFRRYLPRIKILNDSNGENSRTLITYCGLIASQNDIDELVFSMQTMRYANPHKMFSYALLLDLPAGTEVQESDEALLGHCKKRFSELKEDRYCIFVRKRKPVKGQGGFQGWEKKRGALIELNEYLLSGDDSGFCLNLGKNPQAKYVITLDSDTMLNSAHELAEIMQHPFNARKCVVSLSAKTNPYSITTLFGRFDQKDLGLSGYSSCALGINYDLFDSGNYTGKGIYRVKEFHEKLKDFFPDNRVLSHDFIEGAVGGCGIAETALECCPKTFSQSLSRSIRWLRGDWQLLPYLFKRVKNRSCTKCENPITPIDKWHIFCNMLFSLLPATIFIMAVLSVFSPHPAALLAIAFSYILLNALNAIRAAVLYRQSPFFDLLRLIFYAATLPVTAFYSLTAIIVTLFRLVRGKKLLEWKIFKSSSQKISPIPTVVALLGFLAAGCFVFSPYYILAGLFFAAPFAVALLNRAYVQTCEINEDFKTELKELALKTWNYFDSAPKNPLICDNLQLHLDLGYADRTSPTNLGFNILSIFCAFKLGFVSKEESDNRLEQAISALERLPKWHGNFYNWTDTSGNVLHPKYVSTVDNGNLLACLLTVLNHCSTLSERIQKLIDNMDIFRLYDQKRGLLHIGFNESDKAFDGHYDLLASEAMLTYLVAIATGKIPKGAFYNLNRNGLKAFGLVTLCSWGGGLFEYLMNCIFVKYPRLSMLNRSARAAVRAHIKCSKKPFWGVSESQFNRVDHLGNYQYRSFGAPQIALSESALSTVKAPYAGILALPIYPKQVQKNLAKMKKLGLEGEFGLYESLDSNQIIKTYMSHHQGMILASICNILCNNAVVAALKSLPQIAACELLLTQSGFDSVAKKPRIKRLNAFNQSPEEIEVSPSNPKRLNFLTNGNYHVIFNAQGGSQSYLNGLSISRNEADFNGFRIFINGKDIAKNAVYSGYKTEYFYKAEAFRISQACMVLPQLNGEMRHLQIKNLTERPLKLELRTYFEPSLAKKIDDLSHKIFSSMKIRTFVSDDMLIATRANAEKPLFLGHFLSVCKAEFESNRHNLAHKNSVSLPSLGSPIYPVLSAKKILTLKAGQGLNVAAFILSAESLNALTAAKRIALSAGYFRQALSANCSYLRHMGLTRRTSDLGSILLNAPNADVPPLAPLPTVIFDHKHGTQSLGILLQQLQRLSKFIDFNTVVCFSETDGYFRNTLNSLSLLADGRLKNLYFYNYATEAEAIERIKRTAVPYNAAIDFAPLPVYLPPTRLPAANADLPLPNLELNLNGKGFLPDSSFVILPDFKPLRAWCNVIALSGFGSVISHTGGGYTYSKNSHMFKISELSNDPIGDKASEGVLFFENGLGWGATPSPIKNKADYYVRHAFGFSEFKTNFNGAITTLTQHCCSTNAKFYVAQIENATNRQREVEAVFFINLVLGDIRERSGGFVELSVKNGYLEAKNTQNGQKIGIFCSNSVDKWIVNGKDSHLAKLNSVLLNPCAAACVTLNLPAKGKNEVVFEVRCLTENQILPKNIKDCAARSLVESKSYFNNLSCFSVQTEDKALNHLLKWLPYQVLCSRFNARAGFYQAGGAIGFRDQLQDCLALLFISPQKVRSHILLCAAHQFKEGDVQHWWHPPYKGVRTRISDDLLYLPLLTAEYIAYTADEGILGVSVPYIKGRELLDDEKDAYFEAVPDESEPLFNHCIKALLFNTISEQNLVLMGSGDWNDAMDNVGAKGKGTSVFCTIFLYYVINRFLPYVKDQSLRAKLIERAQRLKNGVENSWDGEWFLRAITDEGHVLGSKNSVECKIDLLCQSWAALSGIADSKRTKTALKAVADRLIDFENGVIKLLDPPFEQVDAGYISKYPKGIRENGGQYTHAAVWYIMALLGDGQTEFACSLLDMINPIKRHAASSKYLAEPYVLCGDVYGGEYSGVSGWSWYTGAAAWYYKCIIENVFGLKKRGERLYIAPNLPSSAGIVRVSYKADFGNIEIVLDNTAKKGNWSVYVNKIRYADGYVQLTPSMIGKTVTVKRE